MVDILTPEAARRPAPALSATSDAPVPPKPADPPPKPAAEAAPAKPAEAPPQPAEGDGAAKPADSAAAAAEPKPAEGEQAGSEAAPAEGEGAEKADGKPKKPISERFSEITAQRRAAEARAETAVQAANQATEALNKALDTIKQLQGKEAAAAAEREAAADPRPKRETFDNPEAYDTALVEWAGRQATRAAKAESEKNAAEERQRGEEAKKKADAEKADGERRAEAERTIATWQERRAKAAEQHADFAEVAEGAHWSPTPPMVQAILNAENGPDVAYYLGSNPEKAAEIAKLNPVAQVMAMGRIAAELARPKSNTSKAPAPINPLASRAAALPKSPDEESMDEYAARRNRELAAARSARLH